MGFDSGTFTYNRFAVVGQTPSMPDDATLERIKSHILKPEDFGVPEEVQWGWSGGRHILDNAIDFAENVFNDCIHFALRIDTNKVPGALKQAYLKIEEAALAKENPSGFISKAQKRQARDNVSRKVDQELRTGKYRRTKLVPVLWDVPARILYSPASGGAQEKLTELFSRTFQADLQPLSSGNLAFRELERVGKTREFEDIVPTRFVQSPEDPGAPAEYPWAAKGPGGKDYIGNEFLLWLWDKSRGSGVVRTLQGKDITVMFDRTLQLDCVFNHTGKETITATGPTRLPEAREALRTGKAPRKAGLIVDIAGGLFNCTLTGDLLTVGTLRLPEVEEADTPRVLFEERITHLRDFNSTFDELFQTFLADRTNAEKWSGVVTSIGRWAAGRDPHVERQSNTA